MNKSTLDILIDALSDHDWAQLHLKAESRRAFQKAEVIEAKKRSAVQFGDWILKHTLENDFDENGSSCWYNPWTGNVYTTLELYNIYVSGEWEMDNEDDISDWDITLNDGLEDLDS